MRKRIARTLAGAAPLIGIIVAGLAAAPEARGQVGRLYVIVVADRWDPQAGGDMEANVGALKELFRTNVPRHMLTFEVVGRPEWTPAGVLARIARAPVGPNDALVVFAMGHGAFDARRGSYLRLAGGQALFRDNLRRALEARGVRLAGLFTDHCNGPKKYELPGPPAAFALPDASEVSPVFRALFFESRGVIELAACRPGEFALCLPTLVYRDPQSHQSELHYSGSLFTQALVGALQFSPPVEDEGEWRPDWRTVAANTGNRVREDFGAAFPNGVRLGPNGGPQVTQTVMLLGQVPIDLRPASPPAAPIAESPNRLGLQVVAIGEGFDGVSVAEVFPGTPAAKEGFAVGDVLLKMGRTVLRTPEDFDRALRAAGDRVMIAGHGADGQDFARHFDLDPTVERQAFKPKLPPDDGAVLIEEFGAEVRAGDDALIVSSVRPFSVAAAYDCQPGDQIRLFHDRKVRTPADFRAALAAANRAEGIRFAGHDPRGWDFDFLIDLDGPRTSRLGVYVADDAQGRGAILTWIMFHFPAAEHGLEAGDLVLAINGRRVANAADVRAKLAQSPRTCKISTWKAKTNKVEDHEVELCH